MQVPIATYRVQLNKNFGFQDARSMLPYLEGLGITHLYTSPIFKARQGSTHGYDVTDYGEINPELGTEQDFLDLIEELRRRGMSLLLDIVPNHMAATPQNPWWMDVLENGSGSPYANFFDINWEPAPKGGEKTVILPVLGGPFGSILENQELTLALEPRGFVLKYWETEFPIDPRTYHDVLSHGLTEWKQSGGVPAESGEELAALADACAQLPDRETPDDEVLAVRRRDQLELKRRLWELYTGDHEVRESLDANIRKFNGTKGNSASFDLLEALLDKQAYSLAYWRVAREKINYRRFFDISDLIGVRVEKDPVFQACHALTLKLIEDGHVTGLRIDHIDGLYEPLKYLERLQEHARVAAGLPPGDSFYVAVEKILTDDEQLPDDWPVCGTTGYDFTGVVGGLFIDPRGLETLTRFYGRHTGYQGTFEDVIYGRKKNSAKELFAGEMLTLSLSLAQLAEFDRHSRDLSPAEMQEALVEITACLPVYRSYIRSFEVREQDRAVIERAVAEATERNPALSRSVLAFVKRVLLLDFPLTLPDEQRHQWLRFVMRWQQITGPVVAKGVEDTALYVYNRLISMNEVGGRQAAVSVEEFHRFNMERLRRWPCTMNASSTHDTKRSEDVRSRINVLSEMAQEWGRAVSRWRRWNKGRKRRIGRRAVPDANEELLIYQTLVGAWPLNEAEVPEFRERVKQYLRKAAREAKVHTSWMRPNEEHEDALIGFTEEILTPSEGNRFFEDFERFQSRIAYYGAIESLAQVLLKITVPGLPDFYQGCVLWDFSLVDPDNRRPVDFHKRQGLLEEVKLWSADKLLPLVGQLLEDWQDGGVKIYLAFRALQTRRRFRAVFESGDYIPLFASGDRAGHVVAFARRLGDSWAIVVIPRLFTRLSPTGRPPLGRRFWHDTWLALPEDAPILFTSVFTGRRMAVHMRGEAKALSIADALREFPVALLVKA